MNAKAYESGTGVQPWYVHHALTIMALRILELV
jgi:hypothetical protein